MDFCRDFINESDNVKVGKDMLKISTLLNGILDRRFIPSLTSTDEHFKIGLVDIEPDTFEAKNLETVRMTYRVFKNVWHTDLLDQPVTREYLLKLIDKDD